MVDTVGEWQAIGVDHIVLDPVAPGGFVGRDAVSWMARSLGVTRAEAVAIGRRLVERGTIHHVLDEHSFRDANFYYRFRVDEDGRGDLPATPASLPHA